MHIKRQLTPKKWPIVKKGTAYIVKPNFNSENGLTILTILRDILKIAQTRKEVKKAIFSKNVLLNSKPLKDEKHSAVLFDTLSIIPAKKSYRLTMSEGGKFKLDEIGERESSKKISKIVDKRIISGKKIQINLLDGRNFLSDLDCKVNDSVVINLKDKKIEKCIPLKENARVLVYDGKHTGKEGTVENIDKNHKIAELKIPDGKINVLIKQIIVTE
ncbi:MAG TPA: hypothetical protein VJZ93_01345 [Candidatus Nanoarchaeia archaeon]|nr:hypothetical protein [uncultured archaeon]HLA23162.1 hypothetical protein [Candidatus Nanoarchaeia archaeon]